MRLLAVSAVAMWAGATLVLSQLRWFSRPSLVERLRPYQPGGLAEPGRRAVPLSPSSVGEIVAPLAHAVGERLAGVLGVAEPLELRLRRIHSPLDPAAFRTRQLGAAVAGMAAGAVIAAVVQPPAAAALALVLGVPLLAFVALEHQLAAASSRWQERLFLELPVVAEQLAMLLSAGWSLTGALDRVARRGSGACARDLARVAARVRHGLPVDAALAEWAGVARVDAVGRLVAVLGLHRETGDLGRLLAEEARSIRRDVHRRLVELAERRGQQVWIPVTVAALVPGAVLLAVPFVDALAQFAR